MQKHRERNGGIVKNFIKLAFAGATLAISAPSMAAVIPATLTVDGPTINNYNLANDGVFPPVWSEWDAPQSTRFGPYVNGYNTKFTFSFAGLTNVGSVNMIADGNDYYELSFYNGASLVHFFRFPPPTLGAMQSFKADFSGVQATRVVVNGAGGDYRYALGEVQFSNTPIAAVPEPATWAMMMVGFVMVGAAARYRKRSTNVRYA